MRNVLRVTLTLLIERQRPQDIIVDSTWFLHYPYSMRARYKQYDAILATRGLREQPLGVTREHGGLTDVAQTQVQHDHTLQTNTTATVGQRVKTERVDVVAHRLLRHTQFVHTLHQQLGIVHTLCARDDLLATDHHVVRVAPTLVRRVWHRVERTHSQRELVEDVEVCVVFLLDETTQPLLFLCAQIVFRSAPASFSILTPS